jgi:endonuclease/exonuclease/phosphatase (EEP) superfamily protein YafD
LVRETGDDSLLVVGADKLDLSPEFGSFPAIEADLRWNEEEVRLLALHTMQPAGLGVSEIRDRQLAEVTEWVASGNRPTIVVGDLNATPWSFAFKDLLEDGQLIDSERGFGLQGTWRAHWSAPFRLPIDHVLHTRDFVTVRRELGPVLGSDHLPLHVALRWSE